MERITVNVPENWNYFLFGDSHIGARLRHAKGWDKMCKMMNRPYHGVSHNLGTDHGDVIEAICIDDPRYSHYEVLENTLDAQIESAKRAYDPIKDDLNCILDGNHPRKFHKIFNVTKRICNDLGVRYGDYDAVITFKHKGKTQFKHYAHHGEGQINSYIPDPVRRLASMLSALKRKLSPIMRDCLLMSMGHTHKLLVLKPTEELYLTTRSDGTIKQHYTSGKHSKNIHPDYRWYVNTGSFLKLFADKGGGSGYAERKMYPPIELGFAVAEIRDGKILRINKEVI